MELNASEISLLTETYLTNGLLRIFLSSNDIKIANKLVKNEYLSKGKYDAKNGTTMFFISRKGELYLENLSN